ncbi:branched-chain amino acid ABC transporter permease [Natronomonas sp. EA1]|uniref:branched-chain amino acid ABC transporter permease n=1 Tax=Natronomonas sp. EA1 TaxID=3421655 RepID=UPI003EB6A031
MSVANKVRDALPAVVRQNDAAMVLTLMLGVYALLTAVAVAVGFNTNGIVDTLRQATLLAAAYAMLVLALNLHWGYTGLFNIGVAGFMAVGAYTMAILTASPTGTPPGLGLPLPIGIIGGMVAAAIIGLVAALPALRLEADYLAIVTVAFSEIIRLAVNSRVLQEFTILGTTLGTGGGRGISYPGPADPIAALFETPIGDVFYAIFGAIGVSQPVVRNIAYTVVLILFAYGFYWLLGRIGNSPFGRVLKAIREDELVANSLGKDTNLFKIKVFAVGCALMGLAGILFIGRSGYINALSFRPVITFYVFIALIIGGSGSNTGSVLGGIVFATLLFYFPQFVGQSLGDLIPRSATPDNIVEAIAAFGSIDPLPFVAYAVQNLSNLRFVIVGALLVYLMHNRPDGLLGHRKEDAASVDLMNRGGSDE